MDQFEWFYIGGDDLYVLPNNLRMYLASLAYMDGMSDPKKTEYYVGKRHKWKERGIYFNNGGSGYALSQATLRKLLTVIDDDEHCAANVTTTMEDVMIAKCLKHFGIDLTDTRDFDGKERFHHFSPSKMFTLDMSRSNWYWEYNEEWGFKNGKDCRAPDTVSFHYVKQPAVARQLHALLYHCPNQ